MAAVVVVGVVTAALVSRVPASPSITTDLSTGPVVVGTVDGISGSATLSGGYAPTIAGSVVIKAYAPSDPTCAGSGTFSSASFAITMSAQTVGPALFTPKVVGTWHFKTFFMSTDPNNNNAESVCTDEAITVVAANPSISTDLFPRPVVVGTLDGISEYATLTGGYAPTVSGSVVITAYAPNDPTCSGGTFSSAPIAITTSPQMVGPARFTPNAVGTWHFRAFFTSSDPNNNDAASACEDGALTVIGPPTFACIPSGDQRAINARLRLPGDVAVLCSGAVFELTAPVVFSADGQKVYTENLPTDDRRAVLRLSSGSAVTAVFMLDRSNVVLSNVIVDGNRPHLGPLQGDALVLAGGSASDQVIREVRALETRSWSTIHIFEGGAPRCTGALLENNEIGPAGTNASWADGISFACTNSVVQNNTIIDATDGAIVIFGAPGSLIESNVIRAESRTLLGGINMVDFHPYEGDYTGTRVHGNVIDAAGAVIRIGMGMGYRVWGCLDPDQEPTDYTLFGAVVTENTLRGDHMQYGFAVDGVRDWTVINNTDLARHSGTPTVDCRGRVASPPAGFQYHSARANGVFQSEFTEADLELALWAIEEPRPEK